MFAKVFSQIFDSSISEDYLVRHVFMDLLVLADREGHVDITREAIARRTNVPIDIINRAIERLSEADPHSRSKESEGRRIVPLDSHREWGWKIVNYEQYREMRDENARREYQRDLMREKRASKRVKKEQVKALAGVSTREPLLAALAHSDTDTDTDTELLGVFDLPLVNGKEYPVPQTLFSEYVKAYPAINVMEEFGKMRAWLISNPRNQKTYRGIPRFMSSWLGRAQDRAPRSGTELSYQPPSPKTRSARDVLREQGVT